MWSTEAIATIDGAGEAVWQAWADVEHWSSWNPLIARSRLDGPFVAGTRGSTKPQGGPQSPFVLTEVAPGRRWVNRSRLPLATLDFVHELLQGTSGTKVVMRAEIAGPLAPVYGLLFGRGIARGLPQAVQNIARRAQSGSAPGDR